MPEAAPATEQKNAEEAAADEYAEAKKQENADDVTSQQPDEFTADKAEQPSESAQDRPSDNTPQGEQATEHNKVNTDTIAELEAARSEDEPAADDPQPENFDQPTDTDVSQPETADEPDDDVSEQPSETDMDASDTAHNDQTAIDKITGTDPTPPDAEPDTSNPDDSEPGESEAEAKGPGEWVDVNESMSDRAADYQSQVTEAEPGKSYVVNGVKFDGWKEGTLLDAKGPGYEKFVDEATGQFKPWYNGADALVAQAERQLAVAGDAEITWHVAEHGAAQAIENLLAENGISGINVVFTPPAEW